VGHLRRIFTAPGNPRVWVSLVLYVTALVLIIVYRDRIGLAISAGFQAVTGPPPAETPKAGPKGDPALEATKRAQALPAGPREEELLALARAGNPHATQRLAKIVEERPRAVVLSDRLLAAATAAIEEGNRALRQVAAGILLWKEGATMTKNATWRVAAGFDPAKPRQKRLEALRLVGLLGLAGVQGAKTKQALRKALGDRDPEIRAAAARAAGRGGDPAFVDALFGLVGAAEPREVRRAALAGLVDLALASKDVRSEVLRRSAGRLAERDATGELAEETWRTMRYLASPPGPEAVGPPRSPQ
jgi:hypothetical protein